MTSLTHVCQMNIKSFDLSTIELSVDKIKQIAKFMGINDVSGTVRLPTKIKKYTVLRSPFIFKKSREQFETRTHSRVLLLKNTDPILLNHFISFLHKNVPVGVSIQLKKYNYEKFSL